MNFLWNWEQNNVEYEVKQVFTEQCFFPVKIKNDESNAEEKSVCHIMHDRNYGAASNKIFLKTIFWNGWLVLLKDNHINEISSWNYI